MVPSDSSVSYPRPTPTIGDATSAAERAADPGGWAFDDAHIEAFTDVVGARRDIRKFRTDPVPPEVLREVLAAGHAGPSVGHSQPWRFVIVHDQAVRDKAALLADRSKLRQARQMAPEPARKLKDLRLDGIKEAPVGIVVTCDRRAPATGVLGRATFTDADMWSCACAIQNMWLAARARGLGVGWVTLFEPQELLDLVGAPDGFESLGWLCLGYPDERPPSPGLERAGFSRKMPLDDVVVWGRFGDDVAPEPAHYEANNCADSAPQTHYAAPEVLTPRDTADALLTPPGSLGVLDESLNRVLTSSDVRPTEATLVMAAGDHHVADLGVTAFSRDVTQDVVQASMQGQSLGAATAAAHGLQFQCFDAGTTTGDLESSAPLTVSRVGELFDEAARDVNVLPAHHLVVVGEVGMGNTTPATALAAALLGVEHDNYGALLELAGVGAGGDSAARQRKVEVVGAALKRWYAQARGQHSAQHMIAQLGGPEFAYLAGVTLAAARAGRVVVLDGLATSVAALAVVTEFPAVAAHLVAGQRSREPAHAPILDMLGLEPLLDLRLRAGEGVGAVMAARMLLNAAAARSLTAHTE